MKKLAKNGTCWAAFFPSCARPVKLKQGTVAVTLWPTGHNDYLRAFSSNFDMKIVLIILNCFFKSGSSWTNQGKNLSPEVNVPKTEQNWTLFQL